MPRVDTFTPVFVEYIPEQLEEGVLYVSREYEVAIHLCPCGCGEKTVTPFGPTGWGITVTDANRVSFQPSIANYQTCGSHYWLTDNQVRWT